MPRSREVVRTLLLAFNNHDGDTMIDQLDDTACTEVATEYFVQ